MQRKQRRFQIKIANTHRFQDRLGKICSSYSFIRFFTLLGSILDKRISQKRILFLLKAHPGIRIIVDIEIILVPFDNFIVRHMLSPACDALLRQLRLLASAKPAVVDSLWDHQVPPNHYLFVFFIAKWSIRFITIASVIAAAIEKVKNRKGCSLNNDILQA